jgi:TolA-binding protein
MTDRVGEMRAHYEKFLTDYPASGRLPEAVYWIGWTHTQNGEPEKAREIYWKTIKQHGNDPDMFTMEDLFMALPKTYAELGDKGREQLLTRLETMRREASTVEDGARNTIALRASWLRAHLMEQRSRAIGQTQLMVATPLVDPKVHNPWISVDIADAQREAENLLVAKKLYTETRKWHPRAIQKDRIYAGLGRIAAAEGEVKEAITYFERFEKETAQSARLGEVLLDKAQLLYDGESSDAALATLEGILEKPLMSSEVKARALLAIGDLQADQGEHLIASAYYERIYAMYGKYASLVASAYWRRAEALSEIGENAKATEVLRELVKREDLRALPEWRQARDRIGELPEPAIDPANAAEGNQAEGQP